MVQIILFLFVALKLSEVERPKLESKKFNPISDFREVFRRGSSTKRWLLFLSLNMFSSGLMVPYRYPYANEIKGANQFIIGGIATATVLIEAIFATPLGRMADRIGRKKLFFMLLPLSCLSNVIYILAPSPEWLLLAGLLAGFRMVTMFTYGSMTPELVPKDCIGRWRGLIGLCTGLVSIPAPIIGGLHMGEPGA